MKTTCIALALILLAGFAVAQDTAVEDTLAFHEDMVVDIPKDTAAQPDTLAAALAANQLPISVTMTGGEFMAALDILAARDAAKAAVKDAQENKDGWTGINIPLWWSRHWRGALIGTGAAILTGTAAAVIDHNSGGGGSKSADQVASVPSVGGDQNTATITGDGNTTVINYYGYQGNEQQ